MEKCTQGGVTFDPILENNTWAQISEASRLGVAKDTWNLGDTKDGCAIIGFDHDDLSDGSGKAGITFVCNNNNMTVSGIWNNENNGYYTYKDCDAQTVLNNIFNEKLNSGLKNSIREVRKSYLTTYNSLDYVEQKLFLFDLYEVFVNREYEVPYDGREYIDRSSYFWTRTKSKPTSYLAYRILNDNSYETDFNVSSLFRYGFCI